MKPDQLSKTAAFIGIKFYGLTRDKAFRELFDEQVITFYERLVKHLPPPLQYYHYWLKHRWVRKLYTWSEELLLPGDLLHIIARKWYIRNHITKLINDGYEQIIVLGSGFDDLAFTYTQKGCSCFEFEAPFMAYQKRQFFERFYSDSNHPEVINSYLPENNIGTQLRENYSIDPYKKTIVVAEGFFDYLARDTVADTISQIRSYFKDNLTLITTHFALDELPIHHQWSFQSGVNVVGEKLQLNSSIREFEDLLSQHQFTVKQKFDYQSMAKTLHTKTETELSVLKGFYLLITS